ncbi:hypothetical protein M011DRAFT_86807 [Sporormia fimetaria CBS 119925]|uniref:Uncharacterized protein n=1 Tax=Sporormia fimetaria CBS 119925 TaxID=1340428 RepID=A0A6A6V7N4_9PLEO|nr:hypothetical protein M011DRAFT_86807 [Sporormia fimetaria CBS 119925]
MRHDMNRTHPPYRSPQYQSSIFQALRRCSSIPTSKPDYTPGRHINHEHCAGNVASPLAFAVLANAMS